MRAIFIAGFLVVLMYLSVGSIFSFGWHLFHQNSISYAGWLIPVPKRFYATQARGVPSIWTLSPGAPAFYLPYGRLSFYSLEPSQRPLARDRDYSAFDENLTQAASESGHRFKSRKTLAFGDKSAYCLAFTREKKQPLLLERCLVENSKISVFYEGDPRYLPDLFNILRGMSPKKTN